ncbi:MAG: hypothetical protein OJF59_001830 [Cytophagales bacterium]|jgi:hypothetical protein|nr:hypothetical protein [Bacteroidota bacterium]MBS1950700.1 hypothetical protein [Bacteroidota bacterium]MBS1980740.1 hypothetical protein [Bacteroidota bacterium]WHZ08077.1 MAG: hypothetical protein OJF59_001830 [Cytophagales bacterium]
MKFELLPEPKLEFGDNFICDDPKKGISIGGFFSLTNQNHRSEIRVSIIGTKNNIQDFKDWLGKMSNYIEATAKNFKLDNEASIQDGEVISTDDSESSDETQKLGELFEDFESIKEDNIEFAINKKLNPDFIGFNKESSFKCEFLNDEQNNVEIKSVLIEAILASNKSLLEKCDEIISTYKAAFQNHIENLHTKPDVCIIVIPSGVFKKLSSIRFEKGKLNFRRKLKAEILLCKSEIPVQLILEDTILGKKKRQDESMIAWNFVVAQYYKSDSIPWALTDIDKNSCFVGISFHSVLGNENNLKRSSIAQAFNREGKGLIYVGKQFEWDTQKTKVKAPHLTYDYAKDLVKSVIDTYIVQNRNLKPTRVVVHKTTDFWNSSINKDYAEIEGLKDGIRAALGNEVEIDLVTIKDSAIKIFRTVGIYPVIRGTLFEIDKTEGVLYTTGYIPYYETFPGMHMPLGKSIEIFEGESTLRNVCNEILALTKVNFNNCNYYDGLPITLRFAQKVGEIIQYLPDGFTPPSKYYFYM